MDGISSCIMSIATGAIICGILKSMLHSTGSKAWSETLCGVYMLTVVLSAAGQVDSERILQSVSDYQFQAEVYSASGEAYARKSIRQVIKENCEAYVMEKTIQEGMSVTVEIGVSEDKVPAPEKAWVYGQISPYMKNKLQIILEEDLGIGREDQVWNG